MKKNQNRPISDYLQRSSHYASLKNTIDRFQQLNEIVLSHLQSEFQTHCLVLYFKDACLTIAVDNANWKTQFRYHTPELIDCLIQYPEFSGLKTIKFSIRPELFSKTPSEKNNSLILSPENAENIRALADSITNEKLKTALEKLALNEGI